MTSEHTVTQKYKRAKPPLKVISGQKSRMVPHDPKITVLQKDPVLPDIVCFSHLRWNFVFQRPQHLLTRFARQQKVFFIEEPIFDSEKPEKLLVEVAKERVIVVTPRLRPGLDAEAMQERLHFFLKIFFDRYLSDQYLFWYYTPMALSFTRGVAPSLIVYDCMDELSGFAGAPTELSVLEQELFTVADVVFTGGHSLYQAKRHLHPNIHPIPSSIDKDHFMQARKAPSDPEDQLYIPRPRLGFYGVVDERMDIELLGAVADARPEWQLIIIGPVVKIDPSSLPRRPNLHYLGGKLYAQLPSYLGNWDIAIMPFARNESTRFISPTKTPEFLAGGMPVVSTPIQDVRNPYEKEGLVHIAEDAEGFVEACERALIQRSDEMWLRRVDKFLADFSWDKTWEEMSFLIRNAAPRSRNLSA